MSKKDYGLFAKIIGETLGEAWLIGDEPVRTKIYETLYEPMVKVLQEDNPNFNQTKFSFWTGKAEQDWIANAYTRPFARL